MKSWKSGGCRPWEGVRPEDRISIWACDRGGGTVNSRHYFRVAAGVMRGMRLVVEAGQVSTKDGNINSAQNLTGRV